MSLFMNIFKKFTTLKGDNIMKNKKIQLKMEMIIKRKKQSCKLQSIREVN